MAAFIPPISGQSELSSSPVIKSSDDAIYDFKRREFIHLSQISSLQKDNIRMQSLTSGWKSMHDVENYEIRTAILDPAVNLEIKELRQRIFEKEQLLQKAREDLHAESFNPQSIGGKRLLKKCKALLTENNELGRTAAEKHLRPLSILIVNLKKQNNTLKNELKQLRELNFDIDADNEILTAKITELTKSYTHVRDDRDRLTKEVEELKSLVQRHMEQLESRQQPPVTETILESRESRRSQQSEHATESSSHRGSRKVSSKHEKSRYSERGRERDREVWKMKDRSRNRSRDRSFERSPDRSRDRSDEWSKERSRDRDSRHLVDVYREKGRTSRRKEKTKK